MALIASGPGVLVYGQDKAGGAGGAAQPPTGTSRARTPTAVSPKVPQVEEPDNSYRYESEGRRDPLEPLVKEKPPESLTPVGVTPGRPLGPLERFDMSALKLVGIVWGELGRRALIKAPDGKGYFVTVNSYMGKYGGKVVAIEDDRVVVEELYKNLEDKIVPKTLIIPLRRKDTKEG
jgi:type IV pilus assembly protein PilP